jgi:hypothetical protein
LFVAHPFPTQKWSNVRLAGDTSEGCGFADVVEISAVEQIHFQSDDRLYI